MPTFLKTVSAKTEKRILWAIAALLVMAVIFVFSSQATFASEELSDAVAGLLKMEQQNVQTRVSNQSIFFGLTLRKFAHIFLFAALGFCIYQALADVKGRIAIAVGVSYIYGALDEVHQTMSGRIGRWQDTLIDLIGIALGVAAALLLPKLNELCRRWFFEDWDDGHPVAKRRLEWWLDALSLAAVMQYVGYRFLQTTMFPFIYSELYKTATLMSLVVFGGARFAYLFARKLWADGDEKAQIRRFMKFVGACCLTLPFFIVAYLNDYKPLMFIPVCWMCLYDMQAELVLKWHVRVVGIMLAATVLCCLAGVVQNINGLSHDRFKAAYGIINGTDFAAYFLFLWLHTWCAQEKHTWASASLLAIAMTATGFCLYRITGSRTTLICCIIAAIACIWERLDQRILVKKKWTRQLSKIVDMTTVATFPAVFLVLGIVTCLYGMNVAWVHEMDHSLLSGRIAPVWRVAQTHGIQLFGAQFTMHGNGGSLLHDWRGYDFLDSGYAYVLIRYGIVVMIILSAAWIWTSIRAIRAGKKPFALSMAIIAIYAFSECHLVDVSYNIIMVMPLCALLNASKQTEGNHSLKPKAGADTVHFRWFTAISAVLFTGLCFLALPKALSWLRTFFFIENWNSGMKTLPALAFSAGFIALIWLAWKLLTIIWYHRRKWAMATALATCILLIGAGVFATDRTIQQSLIDCEPKLNAEEGTVRLVLDSAEQPVYAMERAEFYQRRIGGIKERVMTPEDLCRDLEGTFLTDKSRELIWVTSMGGKYLQFSDDSGMYSFDPAVIEALTAQGYEWKGYYNSERTCDLEDLAQLNHLQLSDRGSLVLDGPEHSLSQNRLMDQVRTYYSVRFALSIDPSEIGCIADKSICTIKVMGNKGEDLLLGRRVMASDFNADGHCKLNFVYFNPFTPRMEYRVYAANGVRVYVDEIAWKRGT